jgi:hypothetical protein
VKTSSLIKISQIHFYLDHKSFLQKALLSSQKAVAQMEKLFVYRATYPKVDAKAIR